MGFRGLGSGSGWVSRGREGSLLGRILGAARWSVRLLPRVGGIAGYVGRMSMVQIADELPTPTSKVLINRRCLGDNEETLALKSEIKNFQTSFQQQFTRFWGLLE